MYRDYVDLMKKRRSFDRLVHLYPTTVSLNAYLSANLSKDTHFQFPVLTNNTLQDVIAYYLDMGDMGDEDSPDEARARTEQERLGEYIQKYFSRDIDRLVEAMFGLLESRVAGTALTPEDRYIIYFLKLVSEARGPLSVASIFESAMLDDNLWTPRYRFGGVYPSDDLCQLFTELDLVDTLIYVTDDDSGIPSYIFMFIEAATDRAASDFERFRWMTINMSDGSNESDASYLYIIMTLAKLIRYSPSQQSFKARFMSYVRHILDSFSPKVILSYLFEGAKQLLYLSTNRLRFVEYLQYMLRALAYTELVTGVSLLSVLGEVNEVQKEVLRILAGIH